MKNRDRVNRKIVVAKNLGRIDKKNRGRKNIKKGVKSSIIAKVLAAED